MFPSHQQGASILAVPQLYQHLAFFILLLSAILLGLQIIHISVLSKLHIKPIG